MSNIEHMEHHELVQLVLDQASEIEAWRNRANAAEYTASKRGVTISKLKNALKVVTDQHEILEELNVPTSILNRLTPSKKLRQILMDFGG